MVADDSSMVTGWTVPALLACDGGRDRGRPADRARRWRSARGRCRRTRARPTGASARSEPLPDRVRAGRDGRRGRGRGRGRLVPALRGDRRRLVERAGPGRPRLRGRGEPVDRSARLARCGARPTGRRRRRPGSAGSARRRDRARPPDRSADAWRSVRSVGRRRGVGSASAGSGRRGGGRHASWQAGSLQARPVSDRGRVRCRSQGAAPGLTCGRSDGEVSCTLAPAQRARPWRPVRRAGASAAEATAARSAAGVPSTSRGSRGRRDGEARPAARRGSRPRPCRRACRRSSGRWPARGRCRCRAPRSPASRGRSARRCAAARPASIPTPVSVTSIRAPSARGRDVDRDRAAARRELDRVADEVGDDLADPLRVVADPDRRVGQVQATARTPRARPRPRVCSTADLDRRAQVVRAEVEQDEPGVELRELEQVLGEPVEPLDLLAARLEELGARLRVVGGALLEQLVERAQGGQRRPQLVRDVGQEVAAPVAVAADDLDALLEPVGHRVELDRQLGELRRAGADLGSAARAGSGRPRPGRATPRSAGAAAS